MGNYITTYTRKHFDPINPDAELICIEDIAHALPMICRGNGHVSSFWSVGEHCILCAKEGRKQRQRDILIDLYWQLCYMMRVSVICQMYQDL